MTSFPRRTPASMLALPAVLALTACAGGPPIETIHVAFDCAARVPPQLRAAVEAAPPPADNSVGEWVVFGDAQTARLDAANDRNATALWIVDRCEAEEKAAVRDLARRPWWRRLLAGDRPGDSPGDRR